MPKITVVIVTWNSAAYLPRCLDYLAAQTYRDFETIVVDNGSSDGATLGLEEKYPQLGLRVERLDSNLGFAVANNIGARLARGEWLALLNADAFLDPSWLESMLSAAQRHPNAFFSSYLVQADTPTLIDGQGDIYHSSGLAWRRNYNMPRTLNPPEGEIFSACAAAAFYPTQAFLGVGGFDEDYFAYHEDVDLGFRLRLRRLKCFYIPSAIARHVGSTTFGKRGERATYLGHRNLVWTFTKNMPGVLFWWFLPLHLLYTFIHLVYFTKIHQGEIIWQAKRDGWKNISTILQKRRIIQQNRTASIKSILAIIELNPLAPMFNIYKRKQSR